jgi:hypothetical protein
MTCYFEVMSFARRENEEEQVWRQSEFVTTYPGKASVLHRPSCRFLSVDTRLKAYDPASVYPTTLEKWMSSIDAPRGSYGEHKVCQTCCADLAGTIPVVARTEDNQGRVHLTRYDSTTIAKMAFMVAELNAAEADVARVAEQLQALTAKRDIAMAKVEGSMGTEMTIVCDNGAWELKRVEVTIS